MTLRSSDLSIPGPKAWGQVTVLGGDDRERELILALLGEGYKVAVVGRELSAPEVAAGAVSLTPALALRRSVLIAPLAGVDGEGRVFSRMPHPGLTIQGGALNDQAPPGGLWLSGRVREPFSAALSARRWRVIDLTADDELALLNLIPTAEGAIKMAIEATPCCLHGSTALVLGYGRTGSTLAGYLRAMGVKTVVIARSPGPREEPTLRRPRLAASGRFSLRACRAWLCPRRPDGRWPG